MTPRKRGTDFILLLDALHLLVFTIDCTANDINILLPAPLGATFSCPFFSTVSSGTATRVDWGIVGRVNRHMMPSNQSREPNSRDSAQQPKYQTLTTQLKIKPQFNKKQHHIKTSNHLILLLPKPNKVNKLQPIVNSSLQN